MRISDWSSDVCSSDLRAAPNGYLPTFPDNIKYMLESCSERNESDFNAGVTKLVDQAIWDHLIHVTGIEKLMDAEAREKFRNQLRTDPPEVSVENCLATVEIGRETCRERVCQ